MAKAEEETRHLLGVDPSKEWEFGGERKKFMAEAEEDVDPAQVAKDASKAWIEARRAARRGGVQTGIKAGEVFYKTIDFSAAEEDKADRLQAAKAVADFVVHFPGDGLEEETRRAQAKLLLLPSSRPSAPPPPPRPRPFACFSSSSSAFPRPEPGPIRVGEPLDILQLHRIRQEHLRATTPGHLEQLAIDRQLVMDCLRHYNSMHQGDEYQPAPGQVTRQYRFHNGICWVHGNFVARRKRSGCFSFLPTPRTLFFYELALRDGFDGVVTCTPLDEPVTEAYSVLGVPLWWSTRRSGRLDCVCKTCSCRLDVWRPDLKRTLACGHKEVERVCEMCYGCSNVLHPSPGEFAFGYHHPYLSY